MARSARIRLPQSVTVDCHSIRVDAKNVSKPASEASRLLE
jgi:hypothetical protein